MSETTQARAVQIKKVPMMPFKLSLLCDCGGEYIVDDSPVALYPRTYKHKCNKCGYELLLQESFPQTVYEEVQFDAEGN